MLKFSGLEKRVDLLTIEDFMVYTRNQPVDSDDLQISAPILRANTNQADTSFGTDHYAFSNLIPGENGFHKKVTLIDQTGSLPSSSGNSVVAYSVTNSSITMPYYQRDGLATVFPVSPIKAFARVTCTGSAGLQTLSNSFNVSSVTLLSQVYTINLTNPMRNATNYGIFCFTASGTVTTFATVNSTTFTFTTNLASGAGNVLNIFAMEP